MIADRDIAEIIDEYLDNKPARHKEWTAVIQQDMAAVFSFDVERELATILEEEINKEIIKSLHRHAQGIKNA